MPINSLIIGFLYKKSKKFTHKKINFMLHIVRDSCLVI
jgi:hypothetical protein